MHAYMYEFMISAAKRTWVWLGLRDKGISDERWRGYGHRHGASLVSIWLWFSIKPNNCTTHSLPPIIPNSFGIKEYIEHPIPSLPFSILSCGAKCFDHMPICQTNPRHSLLSIGGRTCSNSSLAPTLATSHACVPEQVSSTLCNLSLHPCRSHYHQLASRITLAIVLLSIGKKKVYQGKFKSPFL